LSTNRDDRIYLEHILEAASKAARYLQGIDEARFRENTLVQDGVIRQIEIIGEAAKRVSPQFRTAQQGIPWQDMAGMRDKLIHDYFGVDIMQVWLTATEDLPHLMECIAGLLAEK
jgi:uncharacterized protein with HEPN domain